MTEHVETRPAAPPFELFKVWRWAFLIFVAGLVLVPLLATALGGFKSLGDLRTNPFGLPETWLLENYLGTLSGGTLWRMLANSLFIAVFTVILTVAAGAMAAFLFAHLTFFGDRFLLSYFMLGLLDTYWGVILPQTAFNLAFAILLFRRFFRELPESLFDAAMIDGCGYVRFFWHVTLPLSRPILSTVAVFVFVQSWNNYLLPLVVLNTDAMYPWPLGIMVFVGEYATEWSLVLAFITLTILPAILMFLLAQRHIVAGLTAGAVKG